MGDFDETVEARRAERRNQLRPIEVRDPQSHPQDSAGVEIEIMQSATTGTTLDMSRREALDLLTKLSAYLGTDQRHPIVPKGQYTRGGLQQKLWDTPNEEGLSTLLLPSGSFILAPHASVDRIRYVVNHFSEGRP